MTMSLSFEVFPPKHHEGIGPLTDVVAQLQRSQPKFISVTYGAGGSDTQRSFDTIDAVRGTGAEVAGHLTCVGQSRSDVAEVVDRFVGLGVHQVVALRGDPPGGLDREYTPHPDGFESTAELVAAIKDRSDLQVAVSAYPERHPQSPSTEHDLDLLADKVNAGADRAVTQMFFDNTHFLRFRDAVQSRGIDVEVVPGIFPIHSLKAVSRFATRCGATIPDHVAQRFARIDNPADAHRVHDTAAAVAAEQIAELGEHGVEHVHLYTLNRAELALSVCDRVGLASLTEARS